MVLPGHILLFFYFFVLSLLFAVRNVECRRCLASVLRYSSLCPV